MIPPKRRVVGRVKGSITPPPTSRFSTHAVNTRGFATLADEIYLEIVSQIPTVPIPTSESIHFESYPEIRRSRHETLLSLSQTSRSLRRFFWRYLWQRIEVREGMKFGDKGGTFGTLKDTRTRPSRDKYAIELVRQLEIVTIRNPHLAQYVNYLDIFIPEHSIKTVLLELARCLSLFPNLHTVQVDVFESSRPLRYNRRSMGDKFEQIFKDYSYPQIRNVFVMPSSVSFVASCPQAKRVGLARDFRTSRTYLQAIVDNCPHLEVLEDFGEIVWSFDAWKLIVDNFPNLRTIQFGIFPIVMDRYASRMNILKGLNHLQTVIMRTPPPKKRRKRKRSAPIANLEEQCAQTDRMKEDWIEWAKDILTHIQLRDSLEKTVVVLDYNGNERRILINPKSSFNLEEGSFA